MSLSKPVLVKEPYTGVKGCYASLEPTSESKAKIVDLCKKLGIATDEDSLHLTLVYSKEGVVPKELSASRKEFKALGSSLKQWVGHDKKFYTVLAITSMSVIKEHARLIKNGAIHSFVPYEPHITLSSDSPETEDFKAIVKAVNLALEVEPIEITLDTWNVANIKD